MSGGSGTKSGCGTVVPFRASVATFAIFSKMPIVCNATQGAASGFLWSGY